MLDSEASTVSLLPHCSCLKDSSNTSLRAPLIPSGKQELQRREEVGICAFQCGFMVHMQHTLLVLYLHVSAVSVGTVSVVIT